MIGGNITAVLQLKTTVKNVIGETEKAWEDALKLTGWLDLSNGDSTISYNAKLQESSHVFICDYVPLNDLTSENSRMVIDGNIYEIKMIDDPMNLHQHLEIFLKYVGGGLGV